MVSDQEYKAASKRGREMLKHVPHAVAAKYDTRLNRILITLSDGLEIALDPGRVQALHTAKPAQLKDVQVDGVGYHLYFPKLDDGIYLPALLRGIYGAQRWMADRAELEKKEFAASKQVPTSRNRSSVAA